MPRIDFVVEEESCPQCGRNLRVQKSKRRTLMTLSHGTFEAREVRKRCHSGSCLAVASEELRALARPGQRYGYDLIVCVGLSRYLAGRQREEIQRMLLQEYGIEVSTGTISALCDRFLSYLECLHVTRAPELRAALQSYPLHIDATCEGNRGGLFICIDGWRRWVLTATRISSESAEELAPLVEETRKRFGEPIAVVRDMGEGMAGAVASLREAGIPDLVCHYHFLAAVGRKLFDTLYAHLRGLVRLTKIRTDLHRLLRDLKGYSPHRQIQGRFGFGRVRENLKALVLWVVRGDGGADPPYPFALPHFDLVRRCQRALRRADSWVPRPRTEPEQRAIRHLAGFVARLEREQRFGPTVSELEARWTAFSELRDLLRLSNADLPRGDTRHSQRELPALELVRLEQIRDAVKEYQSELKERLPAEDINPAKPTSTPGIILRYLRRYGPKLFGHPARTDDQGRVLAVVDRTNNIAEHFFGRDKQRLRRRVGRAQLGRDLDKQPAQVALTANLRSPEYVRVVCGSIENLPATFAALDRDSDGKSPQAIHRDSPTTHLQRRVRALLKETDPASYPTEQPVAVPLSDTSSPSDEHTSSSVYLSGPSVPESDKSPVNEGVPLHQRSPSQPANADPPDPRLPPVGTLLERWHNGRAYTVRVLQDGFQHGKTHYNSLSSAARAISPRSTNGFRFFGLTSPWQQVAANLRGRRINRMTLVDLPTATES